MKRLRQWRLATSICWVILVCVMSGCSGDSVTTAEVTGQVTRDGKPLEGICVSLIPNIAKGSTGPRSRGVTDANGMYSAAIATGDSEQSGAVIGHHRVVLEDFMAENSRGKLRSRVPMALTNSSKSKIDIEVKAVEEPQSFNFEVSDY